MSSTVTETAVEQQDGSQSAMQRRPSMVGVSFGAQVVEQVEKPAEPSTRTSFESFGWKTPATGTQTPDPLIHRDASHTPPPEQDLSELTLGLERLATQRSAPHMGTAMENLARTFSANSHESYELQRTISRRARQSTAGRRPSQTQLPPVHELPDESNTPRKPDPQGIPPELGNFASEVVFVLVCSAGQLLFAWFLGDINVNQAQLREALDIKTSQLPWLVGAFNIANGLSVMLSGSITDLVAPKFLIVGAFVFLTIWNIIGAFSLTPSRFVLFFIVRAMQGLAVGILVSGSMSILGRVYNPGIRKTRVFSCMAAMAPFGFWIGALQGGALTSHLPWIFGTNAILCALCALAAYLTIPTLKPAADATNTAPPSLRQFDFLGASLAITGSLCLLFGLTQGSAAHWAPYTYALIAVGIALLAAFFYAETRVPRPLIPTRLWRTKGFAPLMAAYFLGFGAYISWQFYAIHFWLHTQHAAPLTVALYLLPNALVGVLATYIVSRIMHRVPGHVIYTCAMLAFALGPAFFLPQSAGTSYWALSMPGVALCTFGPDLSFAAASIFITSAVARSYQGAAGSLLMTVQNFSAAVMTSVADAIGARVEAAAGSGGGGEVGLAGLRAIWWFGFAAAMLGALVTVVGVRIPREEEKGHVI